jgi:hypothetical protein
MDDLLPDPTATMEEENSSGTGSEDEFDDDIYEAEQIIAIRGVEPRREYLVKWTNYPVEDATWESEENVKNSPKLRDLALFIHQIDAEGFSRERTDPTMPAAVKKRGRPPKPQTQKKQKKTLVRKKKTATESGPSKQPPRRSPRRGNSGGLVTNVRYVQMFKK